MELILIDRRTNTIVTKAYSITKDAISAIIEVWNDLYGYKIDTGEYKCIVRKKK